MSRSSASTKKTSCVLYARSSKDGHDISPATPLKELRVRGKVAVSRRLR
jgi:hypothetical protein